MTVASMTGFARVAGAAGPVQWALEARSVNGRGFELRLRLPPGQEALGEEARLLFAKAFARGQVQLALTLTRSATTPKVRVNEAALLSLVAALERLPPAGTVRPASLDGLLAVRGVVEVEEEVGDEAALAAALSAALPDLVAALDRARRGEGTALAAVVTARLDAMAALVATAEAHPGRAPEAIAQRLRAQLAPLLEALGTGALDPQRLHQEAALIATRADTREELDRLLAHIAAARELLAAGGPVGRRLDFLAQELGREANTLSAKAGDVALSRIGLELKAVVEQFREQVQNVE